jgi:hypothetical protein
MDESDMEYKGYNLKAAEGFSMIEIKSIGQGPAPAPLRGFYTNREIAMKGIDTYLASTNKGVDNGKTKGRSTG